MGRFIYWIWCYLHCLFIYLFIYLALPTRAGSPQQHMPITVGPFYLTHPVNFPCGRKPEYPGKTHDFRQSVDFLLFSHEDWVRVALGKYLVRFEPAASEVKGKCANHLATEAPCHIASHITCGNIAQCSGNDNGHKLTAAFGYILVQ
jgi:hypothetical protein